MKKRIPALENSAFLMLMLHPLYLWLFAAAFPDKPWGALIAELVCLAAGLTVRWVPVKRHALLCLILDAVFIIALLLMPFAPLQKALLSSFVVLLTLIALRFMDHVLERAYLVTFFYAIGMYLVALLLMRLRAYPEALRLPLSLGAALMTPVGLGVINRCSVRLTLQVHAGVTATAKITAGNRVMAYVCSAVVLVISCFREIQRALNAALEWVKRMVSAIIDFLMSMAPVNEEVPLPEEAGERVDMFADLVEDSGPSPFWVFMEQVLKYVAYAIIAALAIFVVYFLVKKLTAFFRKWLKTLQERLRTPDDDYQDEIISLRDGEDEAKKRRMRKARRTVKPRPWAEMDAREKIRYVCGVLMARKNPRPSDTARSLLEDASLLNAYETARYSSTPVAEGQEKAASAAYEKLRSTRVL